MIYPQPQSKGRGWGERLQLLFGTMGAPLAWFIHSLGIVLLVPTSCDAGSTFPHWIVTGGAVALSLAAMAVSWRIWRASGQQHEGRPTESQGTTSTADSSRGGFLTWGGMFISIMFLLLILIESIPLAALGACDPHP